MRSEKRADSLRKALLSLRKVFGWATVIFLSSFIVSTAALDPNESLDHTFGRLPDQGFYDTLELGFWLSMTVYIVTRGVHRFLFR